MHEQKLVEALEAISDGFALFDPEERLVLVNGKFRDLFGRSAHRLVTGAGYERLLRASVLAGEHGHVPDVESYVAERLHRFRNPGPAFEFHVGEGRWALVADIKMGDGSTVCIRTDISELKRRESALRDSESRYRQLVDLSPDGIAVHDARGRGRFLNQAGYRMLRLPETATPEEFNILDFAAPEARPLAAAMMDRVATAGETMQNIRYPARRHDGSPFMAQGTAVPFMSGGERLVLAMFRDVSEEAAASMRLRESEARARSILETALDAIVSIDDVGRIIEFNPAAERIFGWKRAEAMGRDIADVLVPAHHRDAHLAGLARMRAEGKSRLVGRRVEIEALTRDGRVIPVELAITQVPLGPGRRYTAYIRDITDRKRAEKEIYDKGRILDTIMHSVGLGIEVFDSEDRLVIANRHATEWFKFPPELIRPGTLAHDMVRYLAIQGEYENETTEESVQHFARIREDGNYFNERKRPNGDWLQVRHFQIPGGGYVVLFTDVTEQKMLQSQLLQAQKMDALGQLAGGMAHEFNNILSVIGGYAGMAQAMVDADSPVQGFLDKVTAGVQRAAALTRELLTFSRRKVVQARTIDLAAVVRGQEFLLTPLLGEMIDLLVMLPDEPVWVSIDPDMAAQALLNLAINARDAMPRGGPLTVTLTLPPEGGRHPPDLPEGRYALLTVADSGEGMDEALKARIFEPFFTTKAPGHGTGLGLALVYGVVRQAGGSIQVDSQPGRGTSFRIWFPRAPEPPASELPAAAGPATGGTKRAKILVAEDEPDLLELVRATLTAAGHTVVTAGNGVEALEAFEEGGFDLLLTDVVMPELGGARLAYLLKQLDPSLRVMFMTGYPSRGQYASSDLPADAVVLPKPLDLAGLNAAVARRLAPAEPAADAATDTPTEETAPGQP